MNRTCRQALSVYLCICLTMFSGCDARGQQKTPAESAPPPVSSEAVQKSTGFQAVIDVCAPIVEAFPPSDDDGYYMPTEAEYQKLINAVGTLGVPAIRNGFDPVNTEAVYTFWEHVQSGKDDTLTIYLILNFAVYAESFASADGKITRSTTVWNYETSAPNEPEPAEPLDSFEVTENGYLLYQNNPDDFKLGSGGGFRIASLGEENWTLLKKYVQPVDTMVSGVVTHNWNKDNFSGIDWEFTYEILYYMENSAYFYAVYPSSDPVADSPYRKIPAADVEALLQRYFPVPTEELHKLKSYDAGKKAYLFTGFMGGGYSPTAEVVEKADNADGSFTLTVQFAAPEFGKDCNSTSKLTILPKADGSFQYLSNETDSPRGNELNFHDNANS